MSEGSSGGYSFVFDIREANRKYDTRKRHTFFILVALIVGLSIEIVAVTAPSISELAQGGLSTAAGEAFVVVIGLVLIGVIAMIVSLPRYFRGACTIRVGEQGIRLDYPRGWRRSFLWTNPHQQFILHDYSAHPRMVTIGRIYFLYVPWSRASALSKEAFDCVFSMAKDRGADITTYLGSAARYGRSPVIHRVRGSIRSLHG
jgi:hypothetical protein